VTDALTGPMHLMWVFPGFGVGGAQVRFAALANRFGPVCRHSVVSLNGDLACSEKLDPALKVRFPDAQHRPGRMLAAILHARTFLRVENPDLVITSNWGAIEWAIGARLAGIRHVHTEDGFGPEERTTQLPRRVLVRRLALRGCAVVVPSRVLAGIAAGSWRLAPRRLHTIPNGIELDRFIGAQPVLLPGRGPVIANVAALRPEKNVARLLHAFASLRAQRPLRLLIVGDGPERQGLEALAASLGITADIIFAGHTATPEHWLAAADVFALPSDTEQMPLSLLEAMASGLPAVCTDVGDVRTMLSPQNAPYVTPLNLACFTAGLAAMLDADGPAIGAANRAKAAQQYGLETMAAAYAALFGVSSEGQFSQSPRQQ